MRKGILMSKKYIPLSISDLIGQKQFGKALLIF
jgi:hypothetical protein